MHFGQRDFSIYALDPSESDAAPNTAALASGSSSSQSLPSLQQPPPGVAVGMGLMSWALAAPDDSASVTGILNTMASGESALEVVFALRGTLHTPQPPVFQLGTQISNHWQSQTPVSAPMHMPPAQPMHLNQALHIMGTGAATALLDIKQPSHSADLESDPSRRDRGRKATSRSSSGGTSKKGHNSAARGLPETILKQKDRVGNLDLSNSDVRSALSTLLAPFQSQASQSLSPSRHTSPRSAKLLAKPAQQPADTPSDFVPTPASSQSSAAPETTDSDDEIVVLEKENVDPTTFRRRGGIQTKSSTTTVSESNPKRKRTLSDVAEAHGRSKRRCDSSPPQRRLTFLSRPLLSDPVTLPSKSILLQTPRVNADLFAARSALVAAAFPSPPKTAHLAPTSSLLSTTTAASKAAPESLPAPPNVKTPYVVPEWARTTTATKPRMSAEALARKEAEEAREHAKLLERKRAHRLKSRGHGEAATDPAAPSSPTHTVFACPSAAATPPCREASPTRDGITVSARTAAPIMAAPADILRTSSPPPRSPSSPATATVPMPVFVPCTPTRNRTTRSSGSVSRCSDTSSPTFVAEGSDGGSPLFSPDGDDGDTLTLTKPQSVLSPIQSVLRGRGIGTAVLPASPLRCKNKDTSNSLAVVAVEGRDGGENMEDKEGCASAETPAGSLPIASDDEEPSALEHGRRFVGDDDDDDDDDDDCETVARRLWSDTLPPSSPLPPADSTFAPEKLDDAVSADPEMAAFWSSLDAFLASSSSTTTVVASTADGGAGDEFAKLWDDEAEASPLVKLLAQVDNSNYDGLRAEDILQQDIFA
ncbi:hypothetical protein EDB84DRAFT_1457093 [Lactarius hengduanensis]|nr:hypothetical protein EDB84DRAFT_1457093 [Lactarius hengduanensis]